MRIGVPHSDPEKSCLKQPHGEEESQGEEGFVRVTQTRRQVGITSGLYYTSTWGGGGSGGDVYFPSGPQWLVGGPTLITPVPPAWPASGSGLWQLAPGTEPGGSFLFSRFLHHPHCSESCLLPTSRHLDLHLLNPRDANPDLYSGSPKSELLNPFPLPHPNCWF